jgi:hypothetical protein
MSYWLLAIKFPPHGSTDLRDQKERRHPEGPALLRRAAGEDPLRRSRGAAGLARRAEPLRPEVRWATSCEFDARLGHRYPAGTYAPHHHTAGMDLPFDCPPLSPSSPSPTFPRRSEDPARPGSRKRRNIAASHLFPLQNVSISPRSPLTFADTIPYLRSAPLAPSSAHQPTQAEPEAISATSFESIT